VKGNDVSLRRRALDVLYSMCDSTNSELVVGELLDYLQVLSLLALLVQKYN
jgi:AP-2 complex subunit alpha